MSGQVFNLIEPVSKKDRIIDAIKGAALSGKVAPGEAIVESKVAQQLGVGTPLVREALIELEHQGFVQRVPFKGTYVTKLSRRDVEKIFRLRAELEALAIEWAKANVTPEDIKELRGLIERMRKGAKELNLDQFYECDLAFHRKIWEMSDNPYLVEALERVVVPLFAFFLMKMHRQREAYVESAALHGRIVDGLATLSAPGLRKLMKESLTGWKAEMLNKLFAAE